MLRNPSMADTCSALTASQQHVCFHVARSLAIDAWVYVERNLFFVALDLSLHDPEELRSEFIRSTTNGGGVPFVHNAIADRIATKTRLQSAWNQLMTQAARLYRERHKIAHWDSANYVEADLVALTPWAVRGNDKTVANEFDDLPPGHKGSYVIDLAGLLKLRCDFMNLAHDLDCFGDILRGKPVDPTLASIRHTVETPEALLEKIKQGLA
jgi:hypothetical protein